MPACGSSGISIPNTRNLLYAWSVKLFRYIEDRSTPKMSERIEIIRKSAFYSVASRSSITARDMIEKGRTGRDRFETSGRCGSVDHLVGH